MSRSPLPHDDEAAYDRDRAARFLDGAARADGVSRRALLGLLAAAPTALLTGTDRAAAAPAGPAAGLATVVKPLPPEHYRVLGTNAETRWEALRGSGFTTPNSHFFVRNHTATPLIDPSAWRLRVWGSGLRGAPSPENAVVFGLRELRRLPAVERAVLVECAGNGRGFYAWQQGQEVSGTDWGLGAIGLARWRGVRLADVLHRAGVTSRAVDVMPRGLDAPVTSGGVELGRVRRPLPLAKALDDVLLAYEMNGEPLPPDHGGPVRVVVPSWVGISSVKWVGDIEVSDTALHSPWNTELYRLFGPRHPEGGSAPLTRQTVKSAFELARDIEVRAGRTHRLHGRSWSGLGTVRSVEVSTDGGARWQRAPLRDSPRRDAWVRWELPWRPARRGPVDLLARATDSAGRTQPAESVHNTQGYLFDAVVRHRVQVV
ncbi:sulfite oxidase [Streptomyces lonarensis]|uniref:Sulfite oxidase n=1 Tax=Streptomyces lonarensis TaxID=700599 RepID=A0A7X6CZC5_9ACTN|nr:sulfite oxidase [Streptomyces lonarensis]NJQ05327.1 sulfite oxidase [Streptomyces lonarensis]